jgi:peroxiredoxin
MTHDPLRLPEGLPVPVDDGAADHLKGMEIPSIGLPATTGAVIDLAAVSHDRTVVAFCYPKTGRPGIPQLPGWDDIPGARGCTPEACSFRDLRPEFDAAGADIYGISTQSTDYQNEAAERLHLSYPLLSDDDLELTRALRMPTMEVEGETLLKRLTLVLRDRTIINVFYPVFPPDGHAAEVLEFLRAQPLPTDQTSTVYLCGWGSIWTGW